MGSQNIYDWKRFLWSTDRVGRLGYFYLNILNIAMVFGISFINGFVKSMVLKWDEAFVFTYFSAICMFVFWVACLVNYFLIARRRLHDRNHSGWLTLLFFVPLFGFVLLFVLLFLEGSPSSNNYGESTCRMSRSIHVVSWIAFVLGVLIIMMALLWVSIAT